MKPDIPFGVWLRAKRLRYDYAPKRGCFIRISPDGVNFRVEVVPPQLRHLTSGDNREYFVLNGQADEYMELSRILRDIKRPSRAHEFLLDDEGELVF